MKNQNKIKNFLSVATVATLSLISMYTKAQQATFYPKVTYILPDGRAVGENKLDSIRQAWGADRVIMRHNDEDDHRKIVRLEKVTDKMLEDMAASSAAALETLKGMVGHTAADFKVTDLKGRNVQLSKLRGKVVVVNFWFTSCPPCLAEMPDMNQLVKDYVGRDVVFMAITFNDNKTVEEFLKSHQFDYQIFPKSKNVIDAYKIHNYPTHLVIGKDGKLKQFLISGDNLKAQLTKAVNREIS